MRWFFGFLAYFSALYFLIDFFTKMPIVEGDGATGECLKVLVIKNEVEIEEDCSWLLGYDGPVDFRFVRPLDME